MPYNDLVSWGWKVWEIMFLIATLKFCSLLAVYWREKTLVHPQIKILYIAISMPDISLSLNAAYYSHTQKSFIQISTKWECSLMFLLGCWVNLNKSSCEGCLGGMG